MTPPPTDPVAAYGAKAHPDLVVCDSCAAVYRRAPLASNQVAQCQRCGDTIGRGHAISLEGQLALAVAALIVFLIGNLTTIVELNLGGMRTEATLLDSIQSAWISGQRLIATLTFTTAFAFPLVVIMLRLYVMAPLASGVRPPLLGLALRGLRWFTRWSMVEVFMLGTLIALVRSAALAQAYPGGGIFAFAALAVLLTADQAAGLHGLWQRAQEIEA